MLEAAESVCADENVPDVLNGLQSLVDKSLVRQGEQHGEPRFTMLDTLREYALVCVDMDLPRHNARRLALSLKSNQGANRETPILAFHARTSELAGKPWPFDALLAGKISRAGLLETISLLRPERLPR